MARRMRLILALLPDKRRGRVVFWGEISAPEGAAWSGHRRQIHAL
jgi:hypothetical protein